MRFKKGILSCAIMVVAVFVCLLILPKQAQAASIEGYFTYTVFREKATITKCDQSISGDVVIPDTLGGYPVTKIGAFSFQDCKDLQSLVIPDSVTVINQYAFDGCIGLQHVDMGHGVTEICLRAFSKCKNLQKIIIPDGVTTIGADAFIGCISLENIKIPDSVVALCSGAFSGCTELKNIVFGQGLESIEIGTFASCTSLQSVTIPSYITKIKYRAFMGCAALQDVTISDGVENIGGSAFDSCTSLEKITIPKSVTYLGDSAFEGCTSLESVTIRANITTVSERLFYGCRSLKKVVLPSSVTTIARQAFECCSALQSYTIPDSITTVGRGAFNGCSALKSVVIGKKVKTIGEGAFSRCTKLTKIVFGSRITEIEFGTFGNCTALKRIDIPVNIRKINEGAFDGCKNLKNVYYAGSECQWLKNVRAGCELEKQQKHFAKGKGHTYSASCDSICNGCGIYRKVTVDHTYKKVTTKATFASNGKTEKCCSKCNTPGGGRTIIYKASNVKLSSTGYTYDGKVKKPAVRVKTSSGKTLKKDTDYTVSYENGRKNVGTYKVTIKLKGKYKGTKTLTFTIRPKGTTIKKLVGGPKSVTVKINRNTVQTTGYQIKFSTNKDFNGFHTKFVSNNKTVSKTFSRLLKKKTYYVTIRTYKTVDGVKYYSKWSEVKCIKTK